MMERASVYMKAALACAIITDKDEAEACIKAAAA
jgi:hypothetical protein